MNMCVCMMNKKESLMRIMSIKTELVKSNSTEKAIRNLKKKNTEINEK